MSKGYSREIMEELFKEEQKKQEQEKALEAAKQQKHKHQLEMYKVELLYAQLQKTEEQMELLNKKIARMRIWVIAAIVLALIAAAFSFNAPLAEFLYTMP